MWPEVIEAMAEARRSCVDIRQLLDRAGEQISKHTHAQASHVVSSCAGLLAGAAAILAGDDKVKMEALPHTTSLMRNEFVAQRFGRGRDAGRRIPIGATPTPCASTGSVFVEAGDTEGVTREAFEAAFGPQTAGVYWVSDGLDEGLTLREVIEIAHAHGAQRQALVETVADPVDTGGLRPKGWRRLVRWLVDGVPGQVNVTTTQDRVEPGEPIKLSAEVLDSAYVEVNDAAWSHT